MSLIEQQFPQRKQPPNLWTLALERATIDPEVLVRAIERQVQSGDLDFRTRLLIRDAVRALGEVWGEGRVEVWIGQSAESQQIRSILVEELGPAGFPSIRKRLMNHMKPESCC